MKQKDIALIIIVAFVAGVISLVISNVLFKSTERNLEAQTVQPITPDFQPPDKAVFNENAINPTKLIQIGDTNNPRPF